MKQYRPIFNLILLLLVLSCNSKKEPDIDKSIENLLYKFPQLNTTKKTFSNDFKLVKSVKNEKYNFEIQVFSEPDSLKGKQEIIVFINSNKECYSIPFFSNSYKDYWNFPFDENNKNTQKVNSTFSNELIRALKNLTKNESSKKILLQKEILEELLYSVLNCKNIEEKDSILVKKTQFLHLNVPVENPDSIYARLKKNYDLMKKEWHQEKYWNNYNCYFDIKNGRIYQFEYNKNVKEAIIKSVKSYRQDSGFRDIRI